MITPQANRQLNIRVRRLLLPAAAVCACVWVDPRPALQVMQRTLPHSSAEHLNANHDTVSVVSGDGRSISYDYEQSLERRTHHGVPLDAGGRVEAGSSLSKNAAAHSPLHDPAP